MDYDIEMSSKDYTVFYAFPGARHQDIIQLNYSPDMSIESVIESNCEEIKDFIVEKFQSFYDDAMSQGGASMNPDGIYIYDDIYDDIYDSAYQYLADHADELGMLLIDSESKAEIRLTVADYLKEVIDSRSECEACLVDVSEAISADSVDFVENGKWHAGLIAWEGLDSVPALWFGRVNDTPMRQWTITPYITPVEFSFWFKDTNEDMLEAVVDEFDTIGVWYLYECGCDLPELTGLIRRCPVKLEKDDSSETIREKITTFFLLKEK